MSGASVKLAGSGRGFGAGFAVVLALVLGDGGALPTAFLHWLADSSLRGIAIASASGAIVGSLHCFARLYADATRPLNGQGTPAGVRVAEMVGMVLALQIGFGVAFRLRPGLLWLCVPFIFFGCHMYVAAVLKSQPDHKRVSERLKDSPLGDLAGTTLATLERLTWVKRFVKWLVARDKRGRVTTFPMLVAASLFIAVIAHAAEMALTPETPTANAPVEQEPQDAAADPAPSEPAVSSSEPAEAEEAVEARGPRYADVCDVPPFVVPGEGAPDWAAKRLWRLFFGRGHGVGALEGGCTDPARIMVDEFDEVVFQEGRDAGRRLKSVIVATKQHGDAVFLGRVAEAALSLLDAGMTVAGSDRQNVSSGDIQLLHSMEGTRAFVRRTKIEPSTTRGGSEHQPTAYSELPPAAVAAWMHAMAQDGRWLWPVSDRPDEFTLLSDGPESTVPSEIRMLDDDKAELSRNGARTEHEFRGLVAMRSLEALGMPDETGR